MSRKRTHRDLEDDLDRDRAQLGSIFDSLFSRSTLDLLMREAMQTVRANGGVRETAESVVRRNPVAVGVVGLGLAWLAFGGSRTSRVEEEAETLGRRVGRTLDRGADRARRVVRDEADAIENTDWMDMIDRLRAKASARLHDLEEDARAYADDLAAGLSDKADEARDYMAERAEILSDLAEDMRERFAEGLEDFSTAAQNRIVQAREEAYAARLKAQDALGKGGREAKRIVEDHPMVSAAVALALGAAIGTAVYRSKRGKADEVEDFVDDVKKSAKRHWRRR